MNAVVPKMTQKLVNRYALLTAVDVMQPVGRRSLAAKLQATERVVRSDLEVLAESGLLAMATSGVTLTKAGQEAVIELRPLLETLTGVSKKKNGCFKTSLVWPVATLCRAIPMTNRKSRP